MDSQFTFYIYPAFDGSNPSNIDVTFMDREQDHFGYSTPRRLPRKFMERRCFGVNDDDWTQRFRLAPQTIDYLLVRIQHEFEQEHHQGSLSPREQLLTTLRYLTTNSFYHVIRDAHGPSESTV